MDTIEIVMNGTVKTIQVGTKLRCTRSYCSYITAGNVYTVDYIDDERGTEYPFSIVDDEGDSLLIGLTDMEFDVFFDVQE